MFLFGENCSFKLGKKTAALLFSIWQKLGLILDEKSFVLQIYQINAQSTKADQEGT